MDKFKEMKKVLLFVFAALNSLLCMGQIKIDGFDYTISVHYLKDNRGNTIKEETAWLVKAPKTLSGSFTVPSTITHNGKKYPVNTIGGGAFYGCSQLTAIKFSEVIIIQREAFGECTGLTSIVFPERIEVIGDYAFSGCTGLISVTFPERTRMSEIGTGAFKNCSNLVSVQLPYVHNTWGGFENLSNDLFNGCCNLVYVTIPKSIEGIGTNTFRDCKSLTDIFCYPTKVPKLSDPRNINTFTGANVDKIRIHVPKEALEDYKKSMWNEFKSIDTNMTRPQ